MDIRRILEWKFDDEKTVDEYINSLGNLALLNYKKNISASNYGFNTKVRIYQGKDEDGKNIDGITSFVSTQRIINSDDTGPKKWDLNSIKRKRSIS